MQIGEGTSQPSSGGGHGPAQQQTLPDLEMAVFFDGTQNSMNHAEQRDEDGSSYSNAMSNVALLYRLYPRNDAAPPTSGPVRRRMYLRGIGVRLRGEDDMLSVVAGTGREGVSARVHSACAQLRGLVGTNRYASVTVDVFGFSRGAAAARYFVNCIKRGSFEQVETGTAIVDNQRITLSRVALPEATVRFVGVFDTVAAVADHANNDTFNDANNDDVNVHLAAGSAQTVVHLTAADEQRDGFALNSLRDGSGAIPSGWVEQAFPGAHSDLGGGYRGQGETLVPLKPHSRSLTGPTQAQTLPEYRLEFEALRTQLRQGGFATDRDANFTLYDDEVEGVEYAHYVWMRHQVRNGMDKLSLQIMHDQATMASVPFNAVPRATNYAVPSDLQPALERLRGGGDFTDAERRLIHLKYTHWSAHYGRVQGRRNHVFHDIIDEMAYPMAPAENRVRIVHPNIPGEAE